MSRSAATPRADGDGFSRIESATAVPASKVYQMVAGDEAVGFRVFGHVGQRVLHPHRVHVRHQDCVPHLRERIDQVDLLAPLSRWNMSTASAFRLCGQDHASMAPSILRHDSYRPHRHMRTQSWGGRPSCGVIGYFSSGIIIATAHHLVEIAGAPAEVVLCEPRVHGERVDAAGCQLLQQRVVHRACRTFHHI